MKAQQPCAATWFIPFLSINWRKRTELNCWANLPAQRRTWVNGSFPFNWKGCVKGRIHFSASTMTCRRTIPRVHGSVLAPGHPLHHAGVGTSRLLRAASWAVCSARNPLFCGFRKIWGEEQLIINYSLKTTLKAASTLDFITLLQTYFPPLTYCSHKEHWVLLHCYT